MKLNNEQLAAHINAVLELDASAPHDLQLVQTEYSRTLLRVAVERLQGPALIPMGLAAVKTLRNKGYTYTEGAELWRPPLGKGCREQAIGKATTLALLNEAVLRLRGNTADPDEARAIGSLTAAVRQPLEPGQRYEAPQHRVEGQWGEGYLVGYNQGFAQALAITRSELQAEHDPAKCAALDGLVDRLVAHQNDERKAQLSVGSSAPEVAELMGELADKIAENNDLRTELAGLTASLHELRERLDAAQAEIPPVRDAATIVAQTEGLALAMAKADGWEESASMGPLRSSRNPRAQGYWARACLAQELLTHTDVSNAVSELDEIPF